jgi:hypothetical protein
MPDRCRNGRFELDLGAGALWDAIPASPLNVPAAFRDDVQR